MIEINVVDDLRGVVVVDSVDDDEYEGEEKNDNDIWWRSIEEFVGDVKSSSTSTFEWLSHSDANNIAFVRL